DTILQLLDREPDPPRAVNPRADRDLALVALKCLAKDPAQRYAGAQALADELAASRQARQPRHRRLAFGVILALAGIVGLAACWSVLRQVDGQPMAGPGQEKIRLPVQENRGQPEQVPPERDQDNRCESRRF
ncbi:MAG TPA: hypothetical protein VJ739_16850, partial [Gemmataceae bacterium]|nr:hypothetical protein [Gemmataceae bacterium]